MEKTGANQNRLGPKPMFTSITNSEFSEKINQTLLSSKLIDEAKAIKTCFQFSCKTHQLVNRVGSI